MHSQCDTSFFFFLQKQKFVQVCAVDCNTWVLHGPQLQLGGKALMTHMSIIWCLILINSNQHLGSFLRSNNSLGAARRSERNESGETLQFRLVSHNLTWILCQYLQSSSSLVWVTEFYRKAAVTQQQVTRRVSVRYTKADKENSVRPLLRRHGRRLSVVCRSSFSHANR